MADVFLDGAFVARDEARVSAMDAVVQHAVGLFETMLGGIRPAQGDRPAGAWVYRLGDHLERLRVSALELGLSDSLRVDRLGDAVLETVERAASQGEIGLDGRARVRLTLTAGNLNMLAATGKGPVSPTLLVVSQPATQYPGAMFERGVAVVLAEERANPLNSLEGHKTVNYWWRLRQLQAASARQAGEAVVLQVTNHLCGGCVSNIFLVKDGELLTPIARGEEPRGGLPSPALPGITRAAVIELAERISVPCSKAMLSVEEMLGADEVFLTNSSWGVLPVVSVVGLGEKRAIGDGVPGALTRRLRESWLADVAREAQGLGAVE
jgi:branched-subunit amino acid aminotransferase/4-amino-4-deoxychorismate lyase